MGRVVEQERLDVAIGPGRVEGLLQHPAGLVVALLLEAIVQLTFIPTDRRSGRRGFAGGLLHSVPKDRQKHLNPLPEQRLLAGTNRTDEADIGRKDGAPSREIANLTERRARVGRQGVLNGRWQITGNRRQIHDRG